VKGQIMPAITMTIGIILTILGIGSYFGTGMQSITALIPAFFGLTLILLAYIARSEAARKTAMHIAMVVAAIGLIGSFSGLISLFTLIGGADVARPAAVIAQAVMAITCIVYLVLGIRSFIVARRQRD
jgi:hypothetical protein